jgi:hypothetical protein
MRRPARIGKRNARSGVAAILPAVGEALSDGTKIRAE